MGVYSKPIDLMRAQETRFRKTMMTAEQMFILNVRSAESDLEEVTSGTVSTSQLRRLGHPFARGASSAESTPKGAMRGASKKRRQRVGITGVVPLLPINKQSGKLRGGTFMRRTSSRPLTFVVGSDVAYAKYIFAPAGTKRMVGRGVMSGKDLGIVGKTGILERRWKARNVALLRVLKEKQRH